MVASSPTGEFIGPLEERAFHFFDLSNILFRLGAITLQEPVLANFAPVGDDSVDEILMILQANVSISSCHPVLILKLWPALFGAEFQGRQSWFHLSVFLGNTVVTHHATLIAKMWFFIIEIMPGAMIVWKNDVWVVHGMQ